MAAKKPIIEDKPAVWIPCAFAGCGTSATLVVKTKTGLAKVCENHYDKIYQDKANARCAELGLHSVEQKREWLRKNPLLVKRTPVYEREPGEDWGEEAA